MILVTGAAGNVGRYVVRDLLAAGEQVRVLTRDPASAQVPDGVEVVGGDITDAATLGPAFDGVSAAHLITFGRAQQPLQNGAELTDVAVRAGVERVTIVAGWQPGTVESAVQASDLAWTVLAPTEFMSNTKADWAPRLRAGDVIREPFGDRKGASVHEADIGAVAAVALTTGYDHAGQTYALTGPEALTPRDKIRMLAEATGRDLRFEELTPEQTRQEWVVDGTPPDMLIFAVLGATPGITNAQMVEALLGLYGNIPELGYTVSDAVEKVTGRPARTFAQWAAENADAFRR